MAAKKKGTKKAGVKAAPAAVDPPRLPSQRDGWYSTAEAESIFGVVHQVFYQTYRPHIPESAKRMDGQRVMLHLPSAIKAWVKHREDYITQQFADPDMVGDGEGLDRFRMARAQQEEMKLEQMRKTHVPLADLNAALGQLSGILRTAGNNLQRQYGNAAGEILNQAIDEFEKRMAMVIPRAQETTETAEVKPAEAKPQTVVRPAEPADAADVSTTDNADNKQPTAATAAGDSDASTDTADPKRV